MNLPLHSGLDRSPAPLTPSRRRFLAASLTGCASFFTVRGAFAEALTLTLTPRQTEGPFYPDHLPLDTDNDLLIINDTLTPAAGEVTHLGGRILDSRGDPVRNAMVEIWQVDHHGAYLHSGDSRNKDRDTHFQGYGRFLTGTSGEYYFRTIKPVPYPGRTPHIHFLIKKGNHRLLTTQCYVKGHTGNDSDGILRSIRDERARASVLIEFAPLAASTAGELAARFDIVLGMTPEDPHDDPFAGRRAPREG